MEAGELRIGELARRAGVSTAVLRAWERRYGLLVPTRTESGYRLYSAVDLARVRKMQAHMAEGVSAAEAARLVTSGAPPGGGRQPRELIAELWASLDEFDDARAQAAFDRLVAEFSLDTVLREAVLPYLGILGDRWTTGDVSVAQEHFATALLRERMLALGRGWDRGVGPRAVLACPAGERHDLGLVAFGLALREQGWRITFLGADTPLDTLTAVCEKLEPDAVVLAALAPEPFRAATKRVTALARQWKVFLAAAGADATLAKRTGGALLVRGPLDAADELITAI